MRNGMGRNRRHLLSPVYHAFTCYIRLHRGISVFHGVAVRGRVFFGKICCLVVSERCVSQYLIFYKLEFLNINIIFIFIYNYIIFSNFIINQMRLKLRSLQLRELSKRVIYEEGSAVNTIQIQSSPIKAMCMTCIDFRLINEAVEYLNNQGYLDLYDEFLLAGASLGYNTSLNRVNENFSGWNKIFDDHVDISYILHKISEIIIIDHMDCGAFQKQYNKIFSTYEEINEHVKNLNIARSSLITRFESKYIVRTWLMNLSGRVDINPTYWQPNTKEIKVSKNSVIVIGDNLLPTTSTLKSVGKLTEPFSTIITLSYTLLDKDGKELTTSSPYVNVKNDGDIWYIQSTSSAGDFGRFNSVEYRLQVDKSFAYVSLKISVESANDDDVTFTFDKSDYFPIKDD